MLINQFLFLGAFLFCTGVYGALARKNSVLVLMSIELILNAVNINLVAFGAFDHTIAGQVFALFVLAIGLVIAWIHQTPAGEDHIRSVAQNNLFVWFRFGGTTTNFGIHIDG